jgi:hypothetical protein
MPAPTRKRWVAFFATAAVLIATPLAVVGTHSFIDVPTSNVHHADISWLKDADVTRGCNPGQGNTRYCPDDPVTRAQMATFMRRLAQNKVVDAATANNSSQLNGKGPNAYRTVVAGGHCDQAAATLCPSGTLKSINLNAPAAGVVLINYAMSIREDNSGQGVVQAWVNSDNQCNWFLVPLDALTGSLSVMNFADLSGTSYHSIAGTTTVGVSAGTSTFSVCAAVLGGTVDYASISAVWSPEGSGVATASAGDHMTIDPGLGAPFEGQTVAGFGG